MFLPEVCLYLDAALSESEMIKQTEKESKGGRVPRGPSIERVKERNRGRTATFH